MLGSDEFCKVGDIGDKNGGVYDQVEPAISSPHNGVEILEHLPGLDLDRPSHGRTWAVVTLDLPGRWATIGPRPD